MDYGTGAEGLAGAIVALFSSLVCIAYAAMMLLIAVSIILWVVALIDLLQREASDFPNARAGRPDPNERLIWVLIVLLVGTVGAIVYYFVVMKPYPRASA